MISGRLFNPWPAGAYGGVYIEPVNCAVWFFHGADDHSVPAHYSTDLFEAMQKLGAPVKLTVYPGLGHSSATWNKAYHDPDLYVWFLAQSK